eukprot:CAMPEP_0175047770 /NCGR_PEP_ID=MMETSP0052_2-20121109/5790_1 /TAXON_ID=51329 ORGANISM="Polytomella parva, Strain SAG 63-3" /NCGR_SAMPLE_ID=MMETSP0052_2 /ASSEMBLY_ACC=CAM_ASM_000194 /LENGTH=523 /DNA_ID=CAMNT_0016311703 /DNA_START=234 /DNA_END=1802 /DNA_ORIENTATION=-
MLKPPCSTPAVHSSISVTCTAPVPTADVVQAIPLGGHGDSLSRRPLLPPEINATDRPQTICITGALGYIGSRVTSRLLSRGHRIHIVDLPRALESEWTKKFVQDPSISDRVKLFPCDLMQAKTSPDGSPSPDLARLHDAVRGCDSVIHLVAMVNVTPRKADQQRMYDLGMEGTRNILSVVSSLSAPSSSSPASSSSSSPRRVVMLSSVAACVADNWERGKEHTFSAADFSQTCSLKSFTYSFVKRESELLARRLSADQAYKLVTVCPGVTFGPISNSIHSKTSPGMLLALLLAREGFRIFGFHVSLRFLIPELHTLFSDVDDVAAVISAATVATDTDLNGQDRFIVGSALTSLTHMSEHLEEIVRADATHGTADATADGIAPSDKVTAASREQNVLQEEKRTTDYLYQVPMGLDNGSPIYPHSASLPSSSQRPPLPPPPPGIFPRLSKWVAQDLAPKLLGCERLMPSIAMDLALLPLTCGRPIRGLDMNPTVASLGLQRSVPWCATLKDTARSMQDLELIKGW